MLAGEAAEAEAGVGGEGAHEGFAYRVVTVGDEVEEAEAVGIGAGHVVDSEGWLDGGEGEGEEVDVAGDFEFVEGAAYDVAAEFGGGAEGDEAALVDDENAVAGDFDFGEDVRGDDDGHASAEAGDEVAHELDLVGVEADGWLVHDDDGGLGEDGLGDADALAEAFGEFADDAVAFASEVADFHDFGDARGEAAAGEFLEASAIVEVFGDAHVLGERVVFGHVTDEAFDFLRARGDGDAVDERDAGGGWEVAGEDAHGGGFAGAVGAEEAEDFAAPHGEAEVVDRRVASVGFHEVLDFDGGRERCWRRGGGGGHVCACVRGSI